MRKLKPSLMVILMVLFLIPSFSMAQGKISGLVFGDYYYMLSNNNPNLEGMNGFWLRRLYFTYDHKLNSTFKLRVRFEASSKGDFFTKDKIVPFVKDLYLQWSKNGHAIVLGISPTPTFNMVEKLWGYRAVEKTPLDLYKMAHSRDTGVAFKGKFAKGKIYYHLMFANGEGNKSENNKQKKIMGAMGFYPTKNVYLEFYSDYEKGPVKNTDTYTVQGFLGITAPRFTIGALYSQQNHEMGELDNTKLRLASLFTRFKVSEKVTLLGRIDRMMDALPAGSGISYLPINPNSPFNLIIVGFDYRICKNVSIIPNVEFVSYDDINSNDAIGKITLYYKW